jgi:hypothetical protein
MLSMLFLYAYRFLASHRMNRLVWPVLDGSCGPPYSAIGMCDDVSVAAIPVVEDKNLKSL